MSNDEGELSSLVRCIRLYFVVFGAYAHGLVGVLLIVSSGHNPIFNGVGERMNPGSFAWRHFANGAAGSFSIQHRANI